MDLLRFLNCIQLLVECETKRLTTVKIEKIDISITKSNIEKDYAFSIFIKIYTPQKPPWNIVIKTLEEYHNQSNFEHLTLEEIQHCLHKQPPFSK